MNIANTLNKMQICSLTLNLEEYIILFLYIMIQIFNFNFCKIKEKTTMMIYPQ